MSESIGFVGAGNMAEAMIRGLLRGDVFKPKHIIASAPRQERRDELSEKYGIQATAANAEAAGLAYTCGVDTERPSLSVRMALP